MSSKAKPKPSTKSQVLPARERLTPQEVDELKATFDLFDEDGSGTIDPVEIQKILADLGLDRRNPIVFQMITDLQETNRQLNFEDFMNIICERLGDTKTRYGLQKLYNLYDTDQSGLIDFDKIRAVAKELGETMNDDEIREMMHHVHVLNDTESNEGFTFDEFYTVVTKKKY
ncbi:caltractin ICL1b-like [Hippocampus zosterae]|uniref:caltractin ICL1b-like n=1 Tax=Hippocampus zosterae TaxID=109293 RepID=UPI00223DAA11|nr:caltractin ICL1b-like [Hippocampus zosterae]